MKAADWRCGDLEDDPDDDDGVAEYEAHHEPVDRPVLVVRGERFGPGVAAGHVEQGHKRRVEHLARTRK